MILPRLLYLTLGLVFSIISLRDQQVYRHFTRQVKKLRNKFLGIPWYESSDEQLLNNYKTIEENMKYHPSTLFLSQHLNNFLVCSITQGIIETLRSDIKLGTEVPENPEKQIRYVMTADRYQVLNPKIFETSKIQDILCHYNRVHIQSTCSQKK